MLSCPVQSLVHSPVSCLQYAKNFEQAVQICYNLFLSLLQLVRFYARVKHNFEFSLHCPSAHARQYDKL